MFHLHGHQRSFTPDDLKALFPGRPTEVKLIHKARRYNRRLLEAESDLEQLVGRGARGDSVSEHR